MLGLELSVASLLWIPLLSFDRTEHDDAFPRIEENFRATLDESIRPRGPKMPYGLVGDLRRRPGASH